MSSISNLISSVLDKLFSEKSKYINHETVISETYDNFEIIVKMIEKKINEKNYPKGMIKHPDLDHKRLSIQMLFIYEEYAHDIFGYKKDLFGNDFTKNKECIEEILYSLGILHKHNNGVEDGAVMDICANIKDSLAYAFVTHFSDSKKKLNPYDFVDREDLRY